MNLPLNIDIQQIFLHMFNFVILVGGLYFLLYKPVKDFMEKRRAYYAGLEQDSKDQMEKANALKTEYEGKIAQAESEISQLRAKADAQIVQEREAVLAKTKKQAQDILADAQLQGQKEKERIVAGAQGEIANLAAEATRKLLYQSSAAAFDDFLAKAEGSVSDE